MFFTDAERVIIQQAIADGGDIWNNDKVADIKVKIKKHYRDLYEIEACCYCRRDFRDEHNIVIDIEHVLPKSRYAEFIFEMDNLNISCKRCNMKIKGEKHDFVEDVTTIRNDFKISKQYKFIHPNFDIYHENLDHLNITINNSKLVKFNKKSKKGDYTYNYFQLDKIEINTFNAAQGIVVKPDGEMITASLSDQDNMALTKFLRQL
jgi:hypothetical protein